MRPNTSRSSTDEARQNSNAIIQRMRAQRESYAPFARGRSERDRDRALLRETVVLAVVVLIAVALLVGMVLYPQFALTGNMVQP